jgi:glucuronosyltransferase
MKKSSNDPLQIEIGGFHVKNTTNPLPVDIKNFIESAEHGVVYFSLGGNLRPSKMSDEKKHSIIAALSKLKQKVIWKWDEELNVDKEQFMIRKWLPQDDILSHKNVKLFVTHGGLLSCTEAILRGNEIFLSLAHTTAYVSVLFREANSWNSNLWRPNDEHGTC